MRKMQKQQITDIMESLRQAHLEIAELIMRAEYATVQAALADCQECMIEVGNAIEGSEGEDCGAVRKAQEYCEAVFGLYQAVSEQAQNAAEQAIEQNKQEESVPTQKVMGRYVALHKNMQQALQAVCDAVEALPVKREIAFFPYKASMWDSLESIYLAAKADESCEAYCVPIPYFDKNPDGSFKEMHYEGADYPAGIEVIDWQSYRVEERKPDVIYIHNPYDNTNYVTSVHPGFYAENLKKYTEELIYVPYFVLEEIEPNDQVKIDQMKHFCVVPGTVYADKVILQSEKMAQIYINEYAKAIEAAGASADREKLAKKFLGLGSPKFDKVTNTKKENLHIPAEWLKIIEKPDGSWKKIIFYNTSVTALLEHDERMLQKMRYVFGVLKEHKEDVALLWRPHPLIQSTIESMRPQLWAEYKAMVEEYRAEGWGIYDDTPDMDRAVVLSDAYYGDKSSIVQLYRKTGKPVMAQGMECEGANELFFGLDCGVFFEDGIWGTRDCDTQLYRIDINTGVVETIAEFENTGADIRMFIDVIEYKGKLIFVPGLSKYIVTYQIDTKEIEYYEYRNEEKEMGSGKFLTHIVYEDFAYLFPARMRYILKINLVTMEREYIYAPIELFLKEMKDTVFLFGTQSNIVGEWAVVPCQSINYCLLYNLNTEEYDWLEVGKDTQGFVGIAGNAKTAYLLSKTNAVYAVEPRTKSVKQIAVMGGGRYCGVSLAENEIWLIPSDKGKVKKYSLATDTVEEYAYPQENKFSAFCDMVGETFRYIAPHQNRIVILPSFNNSVIWINTCEQTVEGIKLKYDVKTWKKTVEKTEQLLEHGNSVEEYDYRIEEYLNYLILK